MQKYITIFFLFVINGLVFPTLPDELIFTIRNPKTDRKKFRKTLERKGEYMALKVLKALPTKKNISTTYQRRKCYSLCFWYDTYSHNYSSRRIALTHRHRKSVSPFRGRICCHSRNEQTLKSN